jgi:CRISPR-associated protein Cmr1
MKTISVEIEAVTAAMVHVEPKEDARWRAAPFRGAMRYWFRAVVGAGGDSTRVREEENALFGTAEHSSPVVVRVLPRQGQHKRVSINPGGKGSQAQTGALGSGAQATIELASAPWARGDATTAVEKGYAALWVAVHLGGIGQRSRRGAGSIRMLSAEGLPDRLPPPIDAVDAGSYASQLSAGLAAVRATLGVARYRPLGMEAEFPILHPACALVRVAMLGGGPFTDEEKIREAIMKHRRDRHRTPDRKGELEFGEVNPRRVASPVWVRVAQMTGTTTLVVATLLRHNLGTAPRPDWENAMKFIETLGTGSQVDLGRA